MAVERARVLRRVSLITDALPYRNPSWSAGLLTAVILSAGLGCGTDQLAEAPRSDVELGPHDGLDLPAEDLDRVQVGVRAPDFTLESYAGDTITLSDYRGRANVVLVFYRGHW